MSPLQIRASAAAVILVTLAAAGTAGEEEAVTFSANAAPQTYRTPSGNPFAFYRYSSHDVKALTPVADCVTLRLEAQDVTRGEPLHALLLVKNKCESSIALLTGPLELRLRMKAVDRFPAELMNSAVYALVYVFDKAVGLPKDAFRGDGGLDVFGDPPYYSVASRTSAKIPITGDAVEIRELPVGAYGLSIITPVLIAPNAPAGSTPFRFDLGVATHNREAGRSTSQPLQLPPTAARLNAVGFFSVR